MPENVLLTGKINFDIISSLFDAVFIGDCGGTGRRARLRGVWITPYEFKSRQSHHDYRLKKQKTRKPLIFQGLSSFLQLISHIFHDCKKCIKKVW